MLTGYYVLGDLLPVRVVCLDASGAPASPDSHPTVQIYGPSGSVLGHRLPADDLDQQAGLFSDVLSLDVRFTTGRHWAVYCWSMSSSRRSKIETFLIEESGNAVGRVISTHFFSQPSADYVLLQTDMGLLRRKRNPTVDR